MDSESRRPTTMTGARAKRVQPSLFGLRGWTAALVVLGALQGACGGSVEIPIGAGGTSTTSGVTGTTTGASTGTGGTSACPDLGDAICSGVCSTLKSDPKNCGSCGVACAEGQVCDLGVCAGGCSPPLVNCSAGCVDEQSDPQHCGACTTVCGAGQICGSGACVCGPGLDVCDGACV
ncbi:MAG: hypothetical protein ABI134_36275, partial [Byssovorax sp.]